MIADLATCQCSLYSVGPCEATATQEDLLCDHCRTALGSGFIHATFTLVTNGQSRHYAISRESLSAMRD